MKKDEAHSHYWSSKKSKIAPLKDPKADEQDESAALCNAGTISWEPAFMIAGPETR